MSERAKKPKEGDIMRVKKTGALVRLVLIDNDGCIHVEPVEPLDNWYVISELEKP